MTLTWPLPPKSKQYPAYSEKRAHEEDKANLKITVDIPILLYVNLHTRLVWIPNWCGTLLRLLLRYLCRKVNHCNALAKPFSLIRLLISLFWWLKIYSFRIHSQNMRLLSLTENRQLVNIELRGYHIDKVQRITHTYPACAGNFFFVPSSFFSVKII